LSTYDFEQNRELAEKGVQEYIGLGDWAKKA
jgi:hypothetical protein